MCWWVRALLECYRVCLVYRIRKKWMPVWIRCQWIFHHLHFSLSLTHIRLFLFSSPFYLVLVSTRFDFVVCRVIRIFLLEKIIIKISPFAGWSKAHQTMYKHFGAYNDGPSIIDHIYYRCVRVYLFNAWWAFFTFL